MIAIYSAYAPTQLPIAIGEMVVTGLALQYAYRQRPEVLQELGIINEEQAVLKKSPISILVLMVLGGLCFYSANIAEATKEVEVATNTDLDSDNSQAPEPARFAGMDEAVNEKLAEAQPEVEMKGFRKGKVPMPLLKKQFGQRLLGEAMRGSLASPR